ALRLRAHDRRRQRPGRADQCEGQDVRRLGHGQHRQRGTPAPFDITDVAIAAKVIPLCAMHVKRTAEGGDLSLYNDATPCDCYFEYKATNILPSRCTVCSTSSPCASGSCRHGFCEPR